MTTELDRARSRRAVLIGAAGAAAALAAEAITRPLPAAASPAALMTETSNVSNGETRLTSTQETASASAVFTAQTTGATSLVYGLWGQAAHPQAAGVLGTSYNAIGLGVSGRTKNGIGVAGDAEKGIGVQGAASVSPGVGVSAKGTGGAVALNVAGRAVFSRSGKADVPAGRSYVDVTVSGGLAGVPVAAAQLAVRRAGAWVIAIRPNYPKSGRMRIYLNKVASSSAKTPVRWIVFG